MRGEDRFRPLVAIPHQQKRFLKLGRYRALTLFEAAR
jgi:hypothetical protein